MKTTNISHLFYHLTHFHLSIFGFLLAFFIGFFHALYPIQLPVPKPPVAAICLDCYPGHVHGAEELPVTAEPEEDLSAVGEVERFGEEDMKEAFEQNPKVSGFLKKGTISTEVKSIKLDDKEPAVIDAKNRPFEAAVQAHMSKKKKQQAPVQPEPVAVAPTPVVAPVVAPVKEVKAKRVTRASKKN